MTMFAIYFIIVYGFGLAITLAIVAIAACLETRSWTRADAQAWLTKHAPSLIASRNESERPAVNLAVARFLEIAEGDRFEFAGLVAEAGHGRRGTAATGMYYRYFPALPWLAASRFGLRPMAGRLRHELFHHVHALSYFRSTGVDEMLLDDMGRVPVLRELSIELAVFFRTDPWYLAIYWPIIYPAVTVTYLAARGLAALRKMLSRKELDKGQDADHKHDDRR